ncbi:MAG: membrane protein insertion efficiency factor YidD [Clostridia bacterium]|nr:membrane protein insertion efficiency factor YidD [Clostridia bacterium]
MKTIALFLIRLYQKGISPLLPPCCRFTPTCSAYAVEALQRFGFWRGMLLTVGRLCRCNPFCEGGYDPVPASWDDVKRRKKK